MDIEHIITQEEEPRWLDGAKDFDVCHHSRLPQFHALSDKVFNDIRSVVVINNEKRSKYLLKTFLLNLWCSHLSDRPIMYSRNASNYNHSKRYGKLHFKYERMKKLADTLYEIGYMDQKIGYYNREDGIRRRTRIYPLQPLCDLFNHYLDVGYEVIYKEPPRETIQLRDENKKEIDYRETLQTTKQRIRLYNYNRLISHQDILVNVPCDMPIKADFIKDLNFYLTTGVIRIERACGIINTLLEYANKSSINNSNVSIEYNNNNIVNYTVSNNNSISYAIANYITDNYNNTYSYISTITNVFLVKKYSYTDKADNREKIVLRDLGISKLVLRIDYSSLHRVYNNGSFDLGGRFYGAFHL